MKKILLAIFCAATLWGCDAGVKEVKVTPDTYHAATEINSTLEEVAVTL